jgi:hypothetical protein
MSKLKFGVDEPPSLKQKNERREKSLTQKYRKTVNLLPWKSAYVGTAQMHGSWLVDIQRNEKSSKFQPLGSYSKQAKKNGSIIVKLSHRTIYDPMYMLQNHTVLFTSRCLSSCRFEVLCFNSPRLVVSSSNISASARLRQLPASDKSSSCAMNQIFR